MSRAIAAGLMLVLGGCSGKLYAQSTAVRAVIERARASGAQKCAPVQLAMAESHHAFAQEELAEGNHYPAKEQLAIAERNANEALRLSPRDQCVARAPVVAAAPTDGDGDGIADKIDKCPTDPEDLDGFQDGDGCPELDNDSDGLADKIDECPDQPEDRDNYQDEDGCAEDDNDSDGLADRVDQCPDEAEDKDGHDDDDGCPDCDDDGDRVPECPEPVDKCPDKPASTPDGCPAYKLVTVTEDKIEIKQTIYFDTGKATIKKRSYPLLDEVAQALRDNPTIQIRIEGHTDSQGSDARNLTLSQARAASVLTYLTGQGISEGRMVSEGYGERVPIADNRTKSGREQNRRVDFVITRR